MDLALVTCLDMPEPDVDQELLIAALAAAGVEAYAPAWDDPAVDWDAAPLTVLRSTWNYANDRDAFLDWARRTSARSTVLRNPLNVITGNSHKSYLAGLERLELPVIPTRWFARGARPATPDLLRSLPWDRVVVKPAVGGGSSGVRAFDLTIDDEVEAAVAHVNALQARGEVLLQPELRSIVEEGERNVVWIGGEFTHVVTKYQRLEGGHEQAAAARQPTEEELALATRVLRTLPAYGERELVYARVDMAPDELGTLRLIELELVEPSLFLSMHEPALERFVQVLSRACGRELR
ncbi:MAG: hypothetical protein JWM90_1101 [Thermoleophilia bacterium]|nr:hypothetical protein [Thermoleophilia bacterium]